jgi:hypothetical protein
LSEHEKESAVLSELAQGVREKIMNQQAYLVHANEPFTPEEATDAAMRAFSEHLHDPRTIERACINYFKITGTDWGELNERTQDMWRNNMQEILKSALE